MAIQLVGLVLLLVVGVLALLITTAFASSGIRRSRVEAFARRQRLVLTPASAPHVLRAMVITHRWRRFGLAVGLVAGLGYAATKGRLTIDFVAMFLGWFAGAVVAEWRISSLPVDGPRRTAGLSRRTVGSYVNRVNRGWLGLALVLLAVGLVSAGVATLRDFRSMPWLGWAGGCLLVGGLLWATAMRVVRRPQPATGADLVDADDALRGHALTVLSGCTIAAAGVGSAEFVSELGRSAGGSQSPWGVVAFLVFVLSVVLGWFVASRSTPVRAIGLGAARTVPAAPVGAEAPARVKGPGRG